MNESELDTRRAKRNALQAMGIDPYPPRWKPRTPGNRASQCRDLVDGYDDAVPLKDVSVAGRIRAVRLFGKACFMTIEDESGRIQIYLKKDVLGDHYVVKDHLDIGDFVGVTGDLFRTKTGEITLQVRELTVLTKSLEPLPDKWHGLSDVEIRYRRRYLDLIANADVRDVFRKRAAIVATIRKVLTDRGFMEVETPMMQALAGGAVARPFVTHHNTLGIDLFLRIAPELYLKRLIVGGFERVFELNRNFRNEGMDRNHNPEFTMLEVYQAWGDYNDMMRLTEDMIEAAAIAVNGTTTLPAVEGGGERPVLDVKAPWRRMSYFEAIAAGGGTALEPGDVEKARWAVKEASLETETMEYGACLEALFDRFAEPMLIEPTFVVDFPTVISPLAKKIPGNPELTERFEPYIAGMEIGNAFSELNDPDDQEERFRAQVAATGGAIDEDFVSALRIGMPPTGGLGIGIDRLVMLLTGARTIRDVILFPAMRPE